jgi:glutathione S-transferase
MAMSLSLRVERACCIWRAKVKSCCRVMRTVRRKRFSGVIAALNSIEMVTVPWWFLKVTGQEDAGLADWMGKRLAQLEAVLSKRDWLAADRFTTLSRPKRSRH